MNEYFNRELSWLEFNERVLEEAQDKSNPLFERLKFLAITASNLDEFFMVRDSALLDQVVAELEKKDFSGMTPAQQVRAIRTRAREMIAKQYRCLNRSVLPALAKEGIRFLRYQDVNRQQAEQIRAYFDQTVFPILTPMAIDSGRPFPLLNNKTLNFVIELSKEGEAYFATMQVPFVIQRIVPLPSEGEKKEFIFLEDIIREFMGDLFPGYKVKDAALFHITRNSDLDFDEEEAEDLLREIEKSVKRRRWGDPVRVQVERGMSKRALLFLRDSLELDEADFYKINGYLDLTVWMQFVTRTTAFGHLRDAPLIPQPVMDFWERDIFQAIREKDILAHHPYDSFDCVVNFVKTAATDPNVLAIKQTLYRVSGHSPVVGALMQAAENGKQVTVLVELKARFDEENNILWAKKLEKSGAHVVYGLVGLKTHCKICLVVRREEDGIRRYIHLGTGNYNDNTAKLYTDMSFFTCKETFGYDVSSLFNVLTGYSVHTGWNKLLVAPVNLRETFMQYIDAEAKNAGEGKDAAITAKMNSLVDEEIIRALYRASQAGVRIRLIVRGICCLRSGIVGLSENIQVVSIVDRFLEHSRIFYFENAGNPRILLSSADWMPRNLNRRVEVAFPVEEPNLKERLLEILDISLSDTVKLHIQQPDGSYGKVDRRGKESLRSQMIFLELSQKRAEEVCRETSENSAAFQSFGSNLRPLA